MTTRTKAVLGLSGVFLLGTICGALIFGVVMRNRVRDMQRLRDPEGFREFFIERLHLTERQRDTLKEELQRTYEDLALLRHASAEEYRELLDSLKRRIVPILTPEQRKLLAEEEGRFRRQLTGEGKPPRGRRPETIPSATGADEPPESVVPGGPKPPPTPAPSKPETPTTAKKDTVTKPAPQEGTSASGNASELEIRPIVRRLQERLALSDAQATQVEGIIGRAQAAIKQDRADLDGFPRLQLEAVGRRLRTMDGEIEALLDENQKKEYAGIREEFRERLKRQLVKRMNKHGKRR